MSALTRDRIATAFVLASLIALALGTVLTIHTPAGQLWFLRAVTAIVAVGLLLAAVLCWPPKRG